MKTKLLAIGVLAAAAGAAQAQSSVTIFGVLDMSARLVRNEGVGTLKTLSQDSVAASRIGFRGEEDMGGGLSAGFWVEGALQPDTGNPAGQTWQRRSTIQFRGSLGEIRVGRDYAPTFYGWGYFDPFGAVGLGSSTHVVGMLGTSGETLVRSSNSVGYYTPPTLGGFLCAGHGGGRRGRNAEQQISTALALAIKPRPCTLRPAIAPPRQTPAADKFAVSTVGASYDFGPVAGDGLRAA